jgi:SAM-dependent methyltransferase
MRALAAQSEHPPDVSFVAGAAERLPLGDRSCDVAWMSQVLHHLRDHDACAGELQRVLRPGGVVLVRSVFADGKDGFPTLLQFFPGIGEIFSGLPSVPATIAAFGRHGFVLEAQRRVEQQTCASLRELADRTRLRADTSLALLSDSEFESCQATLDMAAAHETRPTPVLEALQLLVFRSEGADSL